MPKFRKSSRIRQGSALKYIVTSIHKLIHNSVSQGTIVFYSVAYLIKIYTTPVDILEIRIIRMIKQNCNKDIYKYISRRVKLNNSRRADGSLIFSPFPPHFRSQWE